MFGLERCSAGANDRKYLPMIPIIVYQIDPMNCLPVMSQSNVILLFLAPATSTSQTTTITGLSFHLKRFLNSMSVFFVQVDSISEEYKSLY